MKFRTKMFLVYAVFGILISVIAGSIYYAVSISSFKEQEYRNLHVTARQMASQYEELLQSMEEVSLYLLSDSDTLTAISGLGHLDRTPQTDTYIQEGKTQIQTMMSTDYLNQKFYRVIFFNQQGDLIANNNWGSRLIRSSVDLDSLPWYPLAENNTGTSIIRGIHPDEWGRQEGTEVFSIVKKIMGKNMGFIEVQKTRRELDQIFQVPNDSVHVAILTDTGEILYQTGSESSAFYQGFLESEDIITGLYETEDQRKLLTAGIRNPERNILLIVTEDEQVLNAKLTGICGAAILLVAGILLLSFGYIVITSRRLTRPVTQLREMIKNTQLETLDQPVPVDFTDDEFGQLGKAYEEMRQRLNRAVLRESRLSTLQLKAQMDLLQAQVNPHFLYNVLNILSNRGILNGDETICDICSDLAGMLRYAANTKEKYASLEEEISYLKKYFSLLKYRYEHKLEYSISVSPAICSQTIPKIVLQQLVENSIAHGFENSTQIMRIQVDGWEEVHRWYVRVRDNGEGFRQEILDTIRGKIRKIRKDLTTDRSHIELEIGGMGLVNTFARLYLLDSEYVTFELSNWEEGAEILVGGPMGDCGSGRR